MQVNQARLDLAQDAIISADVKLLNNASFHCFKYIYRKAIKVQHTVSTLFCNINYVFLSYDFFFSFYGS